MYAVKPDPTQLTAALYGRPDAAMNAAQQVWDTSPLTNPGQGQVLVQMLTNMYEYAGEASDYISTTATWVVNDVDTATVTLKGSDPLGPFAYNCDKTVVPIFITSGSMRFTGQVDTCSPDFSEGELKWTIQVKGDWDWYNRILVWPNFAAPIWLQEPKEAIYIGPAISCLKAMVGEQCIRLQTGLWEMANNITDPAAWFGSMMEKEGLLTPCAVVPTDPLFDTSKWVAFSAKMDTAATLIQQVCKDNGLVSTADVWMPGDAQPTDWFTLTQPTVVFDVKDRSGITGPTGTMVDGLIEDAVDLEHSMLGDILTPFLNAEGEYAPEGVNIAPALGVNFVKPWVFFDCDNPLRSGVKEFHAPAHAPLAWQIVGGGKSPDWVNNIINATVEFLLGSALTVVGLEGIPNTLLDGILDDVLLAYQLIENEQRRQEMGPYGKPEYFCSTGSTAYTLNEEFALEGAMWETRGYKSAELIFDNGFPYVLGVDLFLGALATWKFMNALYTDYVMQITLTDDRDNRVQVTAQIGDNSSRQDPAEIMQRKLAGLQTDLQIAMLSQN
ncbi:hypothetical protein QNM97_13710 [Gordonia sp. L191]|uniref:Gp37-like protein n=1 Tax=Gordonia sp. L191 TaxID=2982699 RepID=UPI0024BFF4B6|nr:hypothetical protein [Gordonia sp. L191]WHU45107.1 hypothetical protein QNM97_13710 [Gordonia sp. L191]